MIIPLSKLLLRVFQKYILKFFINNYFFKTVFKVLLLGDLGNDFENPALGSGKKISKKIMCPIVGFYFKFNLSFKIKTIS